MNIHTIVLCFGVVLLSLSACGETQQKPPRQPTPLDVSITSTLSGEVRFVGTVPEQAVLQLGGWSECAAQHPGGLPRAGDVLVHDGKLQNAVVYVQAGLGERVFAAPTEPVVSDQKGCIFLPRILAVQVGQPIRFLNSDPLAHNVRGISTTSQAWNFSLGVKGASRTLTLDKPEAMIQITCDIHPWMKAFVGVFDHPYFAISAADGSFTLRHLPPGDYTIAAWHERFGSQSQQISLGEKEEKTLVFTFTGG